MGLRQSLSRFKPACAGHSCSQGKYSLKSVSYIFILIVDWCYRHWLVRVEFMGTILQTVTAKKLPNLARVFPVWSLALRKPLRKSTVELSLLIKALKIEHIMLTEMDTFERFFAIFSGVASLLRYKSV